MFYINLILLQAFITLYYTSDKLPLEVLCVQSILSDLSLLASELPLRLSFLNGISNVKHFNNRG